MNPKPAMGHKFFPKYWVYRESPLKKKKTESYLIEFLRKMMPKVESDFC